MKSQWSTDVDGLRKEGTTASPPVSVEYEGADFELEDADVVIAAITSCTNTSNPDVMVGAGLVARKARALGLTRKPWVKTSLAPGSKVVTDYLDKAGLTEDLEALGFYLVGYGCTTCIGNSGPLPEPISAAINENDPENWEIFKMFLERKQYSDKSMFELMFTRKGAWENQFGDFHRIELADDFAPLEVVGL